MSLSRETPATATRRSRRIGSRISGEIEKKRRGLIRLKDPPADPRINEPLPRDSSDITDIYEVKRLRGPTSTSCTCYRRALDRSGANRSYLCDSGLVPPARRQAEDAVSSHQQSWRGLCSNVGRLI